MTWDVEQVQDLDALFGSFIKLNVDPNDQVGYRGQADASWKLLPTLDRVLTPTRDYKERLGTEMSIVEEFRRRTRRFFEPLENAYLGTEGQVSTAALAVMQHYGAPTRLLDWSYSPFVGLYFAAITHPERDGALWCFPRTPMNDIAHARWEQYGCAREVDGTINLNAHAFKSDGKEWFCATDYPVPFLRLSRQHGFFTICGRLGADHGERIAEMIPNSSRRKKWVIPAQLKAPILDHLDMMNLNALSLHYEGADHIGREITESLRRSESRLSKPDT